MSKRETNMGTRRVMALRNSLVAVAILLLVGTIAHADERSDDLKPLQGTWAFVSGQQDGQPAVQDIAKSIRVTFRGNRIQIRSAHMAEPDQSFVLIPNTLVERAHQSSDKQRDLWRPGLYAGY